MRPVDDRPVRPPGPYPELQQRRQQLDEEGGTLGQLDGKQIYGKVDIGLPCSAR